MKFIASFFAASVLLSFAHAADPGDPAPELKIAKWVKGEPVSLSADPRNIYLVEFWATYCPPCLVSIPHLTEIQKRFKDKNVTIIGISAEPLNVVTAFVKKMGAKMDYHVAIDQDAETTTSYMGPEGAIPIPHAFIVRENKVLWRGNPLGPVDRILDDVIAGKYDLAKAKAAFKTEALAQKFREAIASGDNATADKVAAEIQAAIKDGALAITSFDAAAEKRMIQSTLLKEEFRNAVFAGQNPEAETIGKRLLEVDPKADLNALRAEALVRKDVNAYLKVITGRAEGNIDQKKVGAELARKVKGYPQVADNFAWTILTDPGIKQRDLALALQVARQAIEDSQGKSATILDTCARALFESGKKDEAIKMSERALAVADDEEKLIYKNTLDAYKEGKLPSRE